MLTDLLKECVRQKILFQRVNLLWVIRESHIFAGSSKSMHSSHDLCVDRNLVDILRSIQTGIYEPEVPDLRLLGNAKLKVSG